MIKAAVFFADGFEEVESLTVVDYLRRAGIHVDMVSTIDKDICIGAHNVKVQMDISSLSDFKKANDYDAYIIPGGTNNAISMKQNKELLEIVKDAFDNKKVVCSICAGPTVLYNAGILPGKNVTSYPGVFKNGETGFNYIEENVVVDDNLITSRGPALTVYFALAIIEKLSGKEKRAEIEKQILFELM